MSLGLSQFTGRSLDLKIFDAFGGCLFDAKLMESEIRFDQVRIRSGDILICFRAPNGVTGTGVCNLPHSRRLEGELPAVPSLNSLILEPESDRPIGEIAVPRFALSAK